VAFVFYTVVSLAYLEWRISALEKEFRKGITVTIERTAKVVAQECADGQP
jgi:Na+-transporting methylmalonyl-CoA/oxaloacetate decarboxylase gamma subunit